MFENDKQSLFYKKLVYDCMQNTIVVFHSSTYVGEITNLCEKYSLKRWKINGYFSNISWTIYVVLLFHCVHNTIRVEEGINLSKTQVETN